MEKLRKQEELERQLEEKKLKAAALKVDLNKITFDTDGNILHKIKLNGDRLPSIGGKKKSKFRLNQTEKITSNFETIRERLKLMSSKIERPPVDSSLENRSEHNGIKNSQSQVMKKKDIYKDIYKDIDPLSNLEPGGDKYAVGSIDVGGSYFNSFKPSKGVTYTEGISKVKKGDKIKSSMHHLTRGDYNKTFSQKPFELKPILAGSQSMRNLDPKVNKNQISFYQENALPPIMSPRDRYKQEKEEHLPHGFELDQSAIPRKPEEMVVKGGDVSELLNLDQTLFTKNHDITNDSMNNSKKVTFSSLPKFVNR